MESCNWEDTISWLNKSSGKLNPKYSIALKKREKEKKRPTLLVLVKKSDILY